MTEHASAIDLLSQLIEAIESTDSNNWRQLPSGNIEKALDYVAQSRDLGKAEGRAVSGCLQFKDAFRRGKLRDRIETARKEVIRNVAVLRDQIAATEKENESTATGIS